MDKAFLQFAALLLACGTLHAEPQVQQAPAGHYELDSTLSLGRDLNGWKYEGAGCCHPGDDSPWSEKISRNTCSVATWHGASDAPMVNAHGAFWKFGRMTLLGWEGRAHRDALNRSPGCAAGLRVYQPGLFNGAKAIVEEVSFAGFDAAIMLGKEGQPGNDNLTLRKVMAHHCGSMLEIISLQAMVTHVDGWHVRNCQQVVLASGGGDFAFRNGDVGNDQTLLRVTSDGKMIGPNNGFFLFDTVKVDLVDARGVFTLVDEQADAHVRLTVRDLRLPASGTAVRATLRGTNSRLLIDDAKNLPEDTRFELHAGASIVIANSDLGCPPDRLLSPQSTGGSVYVRDCWRGGVLIRSAEASTPSP